MQRIGRYLREGRFCLEHGASIADKVRLGGDTLGFHLHNFHRAPTLPSSKVQTYTLRLNEQDITLRLRKATGDLFIFFEIFLDEVYHIPESWRTDIRTVVDLGANVGLATIYLHLLFPAAHFVCVEPNPYNLALLHQNLQPLGKNGAVLEGAVSDRSGAGILSVDGAGYASHLVDGATAGVAIKTYTIPELMSQFHLETIDLLKVDIEGAERDLFGKNNKWLNKVKLLLVELHGSYSIEEFRDDMAPHGLEVFTAGLPHGNRILAATRL